MWGILRMSDKITFTSNAKNVKKYLTDLLIDGLDEECKDFEKTLKRNTPYRSGKLKRSIKTVTVKNDSRKVVADVNYAVFVNAKKRFFDKSFSSTQSKFEKRMANRVKKGLK